LVDKRGGKLLFTLVRLFSRFFDFFVRQLLYQATQYTHCLVAFDYHLNHCCTKVVIACGNLRWPVSHNLDLCHLTREYLRWLLCKSLNTLCGYLNRGLDMNLECDIRFDPLASVRKMRDVDDDSSRSCSSRL
jgi:hypothetical protein